MWRATGASDDVSDGTQVRATSPSGSLPGVMADPSHRLSAVADEFRELEARLADPRTASDPTQLRTVSQRYHELEPIVAAFHAVRRRRDDLEAARELLTTATEDERPHLQDEVDGALTDIERLDGELRQALLPRDPHAGRAVIIEIRGAEGGEEANLFARDLYEMYLAYAANRGWKVETLSHDTSELGGVNQVTFVVRGDDAWQRLKFEGGPHRVQRVPVTESQGRVHTSSATVAVLPEADEVDVTIDDRDLQVDVYRSSGAGGQHVNTTDSAVRITHVPSGVVVTMQDERSQLQNRARAMTVLRARLYEIAERERDAELSAERRSQVGGGGRSEKIRTYNFKENRVTDHRIGFTVYRLSDVLAGDLDLVVDAMLHDERTRQLADVER
jgi:peptide chain release factor 1